jgi:acetyl-CoA carboxylase biotin carboxylase subunit
MRLPVPGHAIEVRLNAEDPANNFMPFPGVVGELLARTGRACASTTCSIRATPIPPFYDSLLGKLIVWAEDRDKALMRLNRALDELQIDGLPTTAPLFQGPARKRRRSASAVFIRAGWSRGLKTNASRPHQAKRRQPHE